MTASVSRRNPNAINDLIRYTKLLEKKATYVGYPSNTSGDLIMRASVHQFGSLKRNIPARPFVDKGAEQGADKYQLLAKSKMAAILTGRMQLDTYYGLLGQIAVGEIKKYIRNGEFKPLSAATIARKGSTKPLIDTGQMRNAVTYEVR